MNLGIVIPTLNAAGTLLETLVSVEPLRQRGCDLIVVDGGSTDHTLALAASRKVRVHEHEGGMYSAINAGIRLVAGEWLTWINADDILYAAMANYRLSSDSTADVRYGLVDFIDDEGRFIHSWMSATSCDLLPLYRGGYSPLLQQGTLFRREVFDSLGGFREDFRFVGDADFWWRALEAGWTFERSACPSVGAFRVHRRQLSHKYAVDMHAEHLWMIEQHGGRRRGCRSLAALVRFRAQNITRYVLRLMRCRDLTGRLRFKRAYDLPNSNIST